MDKKLYKSKQDVMIAGVCGGIADYFEIDATIVRIGFVLATIFGGAGILAYLIAAIVMPEKKNTSNDEQYVYEEKKVKKADSNMLLGLILVSAGIIFYAEKFLPWFSMDLMWPALLILLGTFIIYRGKGGKNGEQ